MHFEKEKRVEKGEQNRESNGFLPFLHAILLKIKREVMGVGGEMKVSLAKSSITTFLF